jgi:flavin reductase (DIM6/NTAB) family NADH-FMN oxidoreductase RutF
VSDTPATLLVCLNRRSNSAPLVAQNGVFCVNTLGASEEKLADVFAGKSGVHLEDRFTVGEWTTLKTGSPVLASAVIAFDCRTIEIKAVASHNVFFGVVEAVRLGPSGPVLVYHDRLYKKV